MRRLAAILLILWAGVAGAAVVIRQNDVAEILGGPTTNTVQMRRGETMKYRITAVQGTNTVPYTGATGVTGLLYDVRLGDVVARGTGTVDSAATGIFTVHVTPSVGLEVGDYYQVRALVYGVTGVVGTVAWDPAYVDNSACSTCSASTGGGSVIVVQTNITYISVTNQLDNITSTIENYYTSGVSSVAGATGVVTVAGDIEATSTGTVLNLHIVGGSLQSTWATNQDGGTFLLTNANARLNERLIVGPNNSIGATATNISIIGGAGLNTISNGANNVIIGGSAHNVAGGANSGGAAILSGTNHSLGASSANSVIGGGRRNRITGGWESTIAGGFGNFIATDYSTIGGGFFNSNSTVGAEGATIAGGEFNVANGKYSMVLGGVSNRALGLGSAALGSMATVAITGANAIAINCVPASPLTNSTPRSLVIQADEIKFIIGTNTGVWSAAGPTWNGAPYP